VIAFETGLWEAAAVQQNFDNSTATEAMKQSLYSVWKTEELEQLFTYMKEQKEKGKPLTLAGFDMNLFYKSSFRSYAKEWLQKVNPEVKSEFDTAVSELIELDRYYNKNKTYFKNDIRLYEDAAIQLCWPKYDGLSSTAYQRPNGHNWCICV